MIKGLLISYFDISSDASVIYAVTKGYLLYKSEDGGVTFSLVKNIRSDVLNVIT